MNKTLKTTLIVIGVLILAGSALFAGWALAGGRTHEIVSRPVGTMNDRCVNWFDNSRPDSRGFEPGTGTRRHPGGMMNGGGFGRMMQGYGSSLATTPLTVDHAKGAAQEYIDSLNLSDLKIAEVMIFDNGAYVRVVEESTGIGAFELLIDPFTLVVTPEHGPNMMWNLKFSGLNHANMMGGNRGGMMSNHLWDGIIPDVSPKMAVSAAQALQDAQVYLDSTLPGTEVVDAAEPFYGYYTIDVMRDGKIYGMLSVNGSTGQVIYHFWHGNFIEMSEDN